ncbi:MAG: hypothetical protein NC397_01715 [Clostridium sp.]|nr:hypothetical protein [Clostridium sp.]
MKNIDFAGNKRVLEQLGCLIDAKRFPHAIVIEGEQGLGKRTLAHFIAAALVCRNEEKPCMECSQCRKALSSIHPDIFEHSASGGANSFHVDVIRQVVNDAYMQPNEAEHKVYILGNADAMSVSAQNALLKVLEEPPHYVVFILTAKSKSMLLETVLSRSVVISLEGVDINEGIKYISNHFDNIDTNKTKALLETFNGNIGKTIDSLKDGKMGELTELCVKICNALVNENEYALLTACSAFQKDRQTIINAMDFLKNIFRDALVYKPDAQLISGQNETARLLKGKITRQKLIDLIGICDTLKEMAMKNANNSLLITKICYSLRQAIGR